MKNVMKRALNKTWKNEAGSCVELKNGQTGWLGSVLVVTALLVILALVSAAQADEMSPGSVFRDCEQCPEMVVVPTRSFQMGDSVITDEQPIHHVEIGYPFVVSRYEVMFAEWAACVAAGGCTHRPGDSGWGRGTRPAINVSWHDAQEYVKWLSRKTEKPYRLLSEAEWEYVARAGTTTKYWWGNDIGTNKANCVGCGSEWDTKSTSPVGSFKENAFGVFDTAGNVWEWVADCWNKNYEGAPVDGRIWTSGNCNLHVVRGGSWLSPPNILRSTARYKFESNMRSNDGGFRIALTLFP